MRVVIPWTDFDHLLDTAFEQIRHYAVNDIAVSLRLLRALADLATTTDDERMRERLVLRGRRIVAGCATRIDANDFKRLESRLAELEARVGWPTGHVNLQKNVHSAFSCDQFNDCRFRNLELSVPMMEPAKDRMHNNVSELLIGRVQGASFRAKDVVAPRYNRWHISQGFGEGAPRRTRSNDQCRRAGPTRSSVQHIRSAGEPNEVGRSRIPMARTRALNAPPNALSLYLGAVSQGNASVIWRASHATVGF